VVKIDINYRLLWIALIFFSLLVVGQLSSCLMDVSPFWDSFSEKVKNP